MLVNITKKWFDGEPKNAVKASVDASDNTGLTIIANVAGEAYNDWEVNLIDPNTTEGQDLEIEIIEEDKEINITLATEEGAKTITTTFADLKDALEDYFITVVYVDNDKTKKVAEEDGLELAGGAYGTVCQDIYVTVEHDSDYYVNILPNSIHDANWRKVTLATY